MASNIGLCFMDVADDSEVTHALYWIANGAVCRGGRRFGGLLGEQSSKHGKGAKASKLFLRGSRIRTPLICFWKTFPIYFLLARNGFHEVHGELPDGGILFSSWGKCGSVLNGNSALTANNT